MKSIKTLALMIAAVGSMALSGCATDGAMFNPQAQVAQANFGIIQSVRPTMVNVNNTSGVGMVGGAVVGGVLGNQVGKGNGRKLATVLGAVAGGVAGNTIESRNSQQTVPGYELEVNTDAGQRLRIVQPDQGQGFRSGTRVRLVQRDGQLVATY